MTTNVNRIEQTAQAGQYTASSAAGSTQTTFIDVKKNPKELETNPALAAFIKSEEFQKMSPEEQIAALQQNFFPNSTPDEVKGYLSVARQAIKDNEEAAPVDDTTETYAEPADEYEAYAQKIGFKGDIDALIKKLNDDAKAGTIDEEGQALLDKYNAPQTEEAVENTNNEGLISQEELNSKEWKRKPVEEKVERYMEAFLEKTDETYQKLLSEGDEEAIKKYRDTQIGKYIGARMPEWGSLNNSQKTAKLVELAVTLEKLSSENKTIDDYVKMVEDNSPKVKYFNDLQNSLVSDEERQTEAWKKLPAEQKLARYIDAFYTKNDPEYAKLKTEEDKRAYLDKKISDLATKFNPNWNNLSPEAKEAEYTKLLAVIDAFDKAGIDDLGQIVKMPPSKLNEILAEALGDDEQFQKLYIAQAKSIEDFKAAHNGIEPKNYDELIKFMQKNEDNLTPEQKEVLRMFKTMGDIMPESMKQAYEPPKTSLATKYKYNGGSIDEDIQKGMSVKKIVARFKEYSLSPKDVKQIEFRMKKLGYSQAQIDAVLKDIMSDTEAVQMDAMGKISGKTAGCIVVAGVLRAKGRTKALQNSTELDAKFFKGKDFDEVAVHRLQDKELAGSVAKGINTYMPEDEANSHSSTLMQSDNVSDASKAVFSQSIVETAPTPQRQLSMGRTLSQIDNAAVTEGLAAASKSVDKSVRSEYNSYVETAAKNYPPETQNVIKTAMKTGEVSQTTLSKTTPSQPLSDTKQTQQTSQTEQSQSAQQTSQTAAANAVQNETKTQAASSASVSTAATTPVSQTSASTVSQTPTASKTSTDVKAAGTTQVSTTSTSTSSNAGTGSANVSSVQQSSSVDETQHLEQIRDEAAQNAKNTADEIQSSIQEREAEKQISEMVDSVIEELGANGELTLTDKEKIKQQLMNAGSISKVYEIITQLGAKNLFLDKLITIGSTYVINAFIDNVNDKDVIEQLYLRCSIDTVKKDLLSKLPEERIHSLLSQKKVQNLNDIDYKIIQSYVSKNLGTMHYEDFKMYAQYLPGDVRERLTERFNEIHGIQQAPAAETAAVQNKPQDEIADDEVQPKQETEAVKDEKPQDARRKTQDKKPFFAANEVRKTLNDGRIVKPKETFAGVSDVFDDDAYEDVTEQAMNDEVLTPGSDAWRQKYGRYEYQAPTTAFTIMADMEEDDELTMGYPPQTIPHWKYKGKLNFKG